MLANFLLAVLVIGAFALLAVLGYLFAAALVHHDWSQATAWGVAILIIDGARSNG